MKKLIFALTLAALSMQLSAQTAISEADCEALKDIDGTSGVTVVWQFDPGSGTIDVANCNCATNPPTDQDLDGWAGIENTGTTITSLSLLNVVGTNIPDALYKKVSYAGDIWLKDLTWLTIGGTGRSTALPTFEDGALPSLKKLWWFNESNMPEVPDLSQQTSPTTYWPLAALEEIRFYNFDNLNGYYNLQSSKLEELTNRTGMVTITLIDLDFSGGAPAFDNIYAGSKNTLKAFVVQDVFTGHNSSGSWYPTDFITTSWPELLDFSLSNSSFGGWDLEDLSGGNTIFNSTNFPKLTAIRVEGCGFTGTIPEDAFSMSTMRLIYINNNGMTGDILPSGLSSTSPVEQYIANSNDFSKANDNDMKTQLGLFQHMDNLTRLQIADCGLRCDIDNLDLEHATGLQYFDIANNSFSGTLESYYGSMPLKEFRCTENMLTYIPTLTSTDIGVLQIAKNYFDLDDVYRATAASECKLVIADNSSEASFEIAPQHSKVVSATRAINISDEGLNKEEAGIRIITTEALDIVSGTAKNVVAYNWKRDNGTTDVTADGTTNAAVYLWEEGDNSNSGATWYCEVYIDDDNISGCTATSTFYEELVFECEHTSITFDTGDPCDLTNPNAGGGGSVPNAQNEGDDNRTVGTWENIETSPKSSVSREVKVFPNPTSNQVNISAPEDIQWITIRDLNGKEVTSGRVSGSDFSYSLDGLRTGFYIMELSGPNGWYRVRISKK